MPWSRVVSFTDPFPYQAAIRAADIELYPTARGQFHAELTQITLNKLWMQSLNENLPLIYARSYNQAVGQLAFSPLINSWENSTAEWRFRLVTSSHSTTRCTTEPAGIAGINDVPDNR